MGYDFFDIEGCPSEGLATSCKNLLQAGYLLSSIGFRQSILACFLTLIGVERRGKSCRELSHKEANRDER